MPDIPAKTGRRKNGTFRKGVSGNPKGRPAGSRHSVSLAAEVLMFGEAEALTRQVVQQALGGDAAALRMCMDRIYPAPKDRPVNFALPAVKTLLDHSSVVATLLEAMATGSLTPNEARSFVKVLEAHASALSLGEIELRLTALESKNDR